MSVRLYQILASFSTVYIERSNMQVELIRIRKNIEFIDAGNFEAGTFATDVFMKLDSLLSVMSRHCSVQCAEHFGT